MKFLLPTLITVAVTVFLLVVMWRAWQSRAPHADATTAALEAEPVVSTTLGLGDQDLEVIAAFDRVFYVSTTIAGEPLQRVQIKGLRYRGFAQVRVLQGGITVQVQGEDEVLIAAAKVLETTTAQTRIGKTVEKDGLATFVWQASETQNYDTAFRFDTATEQKSFMAAVTEMMQRQKRETKV